MLRGEDWVPGEHADPVSPVAKKLSVEPGRLVDSPRIINPKNPGIGAVSYIESQDGPWDGEKGHKEVLGRYVHLFKGFHDARPEDIDMNIVGQHWTIDPSVAENYATHGEDGTWNRGNNHTVLEGRILKDHLMKYEDMTDNFRSQHVMNRGVGFANASREVPLVEGKPIHIVATHDIVTDENRKPVSSVRKETTLLTGITNPNKRMAGRKNG
jgi:hypothetical protein